MSNKDLVLKALMDHKVEPINTPLGNEFIIDNEWPFEMDYDGRLRRPYYDIRGMAIENSWLS